MSPRQKRCESETPVMHGSREKTATLLAKSCNIQPSLCITILILWLQRVNPMTVFIGTMVYIYRPNFTIKVQLNVFR